MREINLGVPDSGNEEADGGVLVDDSLDEPTMGDRLADLNLVDSDAVMNNESNLDAKPPSADSVHILLKQALNADDRVLLLDCLYTQDEKVSLFFFIFWYLVLIIVSL